MRPLRAAISVVLVCALAAPAWAAPAVVRVFEAQAHEEPDANSAVLHVFPEDAKLSVSEDATDGWRRVRLPDGRTGFVRDDEIAVVAPPPIQPLPRRYPPPARALAADMPSVIRVKNLEHLAFLAQDDPVVGPQANALALRRTASIGIMVGAIGAGIALGVAGLTVLANEKCFDAPTNSICDKQPNFPAVVAAPLLAAGGVLTWLLMKPTRSDVADVIDAWNARHRDQVFQYAR